MEFADKAKADDLIIEVEFNDDDDKKRNVDHSGHNINENIDSLAIESKKNDGDNSQLADKSQMINEDQKKSPEPQLERVESHDSKIDKSDSKTSTIYNDRDDKDDDNLLIMKDPENQNKENQVKDPTRKILVLGKVQFEIIKNSTYLREHFCLLIHIYSGMICYDFKAEDKSTIAAYIKKGPKTINICCAIGDGINDVLMMDRAD